MRSLSPEILKYDRNNDEEEFGCVAKCWIKVAQQIIPRLVCSLPMTAAVSTDRLILISKGILTALSTHDFYYRNDLGQIQYIVDTCDPICFSSPMTAAVSTDRSILLTNSHRS